MTVQTTYSTTHAALYPGQIPDGQVYNSISKLNKSGANIPYGYGVVRDGADSAKVAGAVFAADDIVGIAVRELDRAYQDGEVFGAQDGRSFSVLTMGPIAVVAVNDVVSGDSVFIGQDGTIRNVAAGGAVQLPNSKFTSDATAGDIAKISVVIGG